MNGGGCGREIPTPLATQTLPSPSNQPTMPLAPPHLSKQERRDGRSLLSREALIADIERKGLLTLVPAEVKQVRAIGEDWGEEAVNQGLGVGVGSVDLNWWVGWGGQRRALCPRLPVGPPACWTRCLHSLNPTEPSLPPTSLAQVFGLLESDFNPLQLCKVAAPLLDQLATLNQPVTGEPASAASSTVPGRLAAVLGSLGGASPAVWRFAGGSAALM